MYGSRVSLNKLQKHLGIEILGKIIHPEEFIEIHVPNKSFQKIN